MSLTPPVRNSETGTIQDTVRQISTISVEDGKGGNQFWLSMTTTTWFESGRHLANTSLSVRCRHCNWGYKVFPIVEVEGFVLLAKETQRHVGECQRTGRTLDIHSTDVDTTA